MICEVCGRGEACGREREALIGGDTMEAEECYRLGYERLRAALESSIATTLDAAAQHVESHIGNGWTGPEHVQLRGIAGGIRALAPHLTAPAAPPTSGAGS